MPVEIEAHTVPNFEATVNVKVGTTGQIRGARGSRPFKLVNEIMSLTKVGKSIGKIQLFNHFNHSV